MRIAELSRDSGVPVPTIKYYVREGLLEPGELTSPNQAQYGDSHLRRLKLIRALAEVGGLSIAAIGQLLAAISSPSTSSHEAFGKAQYATTPHYHYHASDAAWQAAAQQAAEVISRRGWRVGQDSPARKLLTSVLAALRDLGQDDLLSLADAYAAPAEQIAAADLTAIMRRPTLDSQLEGVIIGTTLGDTLIASLRRLAEEDASTRRAAPGPHPAAPREAGQPDAGRLPGASARGHGLRPGQLARSLADADAAVQPVQRPG
jgi:DNA-binding transcriptional MerR regulator